MPQKTKDHKPSYNRPLPPPPGLPKQHIKVHYLQEDHVRTEYIQGYWMFREGMLIIETGESTYVYNKRFVIYFTARNIEEDGDEGTG